MQETTKPDKIWDCIVVGAGIEGSNTARYSASLGKKTLCLEQVLSSFGHCCNTFLVVFNCCFVVVWSEAETLLISSRFAHK